MCFSKDGSTGRFVASARFDANETVLYNVYATNAMLTGELVQGEEDVDRVCDGGSWGG